MIIKVSIKAMVLAKGARKLPGASLSFSAPQRQQQPLQKHLKFSSKMTNTFCLHQSAKHTPS